MATVCWLLLLVTMTAGMVQAVDDVDVDAAKNLGRSAPNGIRDPKLQPQDCHEILTVDHRKSSGVYTIYVGRPHHQLSPVEVYCDMTTDGGGWTVLMRRKDGTLNFYQKWNDYKKGFGKPDGEFWLGNDNIHLLTSMARQKLRIDLEDFEGNTSYAEYDNFVVGSEEEEYKLWSLGTYNGTAGDSLAGVGRVIHTGSKFSTMDHGDAKHRGHRCAYLFKGAWWYIPHHCLRCQLTGLYLYGHHMGWKSVIWYTWTGHTYSLKFAEMKIRPNHA